MARIVTLGPVSNTSVTFEEAFGEYSELRGRRAGRKAKRQESRQDRKEGRQEARQERKATTGRKRRKTTRQEARQQRRGDRQEARQDRKSRRIDLREERQGARQERRTIRTQGKVDRKSGQYSRDEAALDQGLDTATPQEMGGTGDSTAYTQPETSQTYADETQGQGSTSSPEGGYEGGYESDAPQGGGSQGGGYDAGPEEGAPYEDEEGATYGGEQGYYGDDQEEPESGEGVYDEQGDYIGDESGYLNDYQASDDFNFDGIMGAEDRFNEMTGPQSINVDSDVQDIANKLAWNQELVKRLEDKRKSTPNMAQGISRQIIMRKKRMKDLQQELDDFSNCCGEWSNADGTPETCAMRKQMVGHAWGIAKRNRARKGKPVDVVRVKKSLDPKFSKNKIVIPRTSNAEGTGLNGLDLVDDFDAPRVREIYLGADGSKSGISWGSVIIGAAVGVAAIWAIRKYKLLK